METTSYSLYYDAPKSIELLDPKDGKQKRRERRALDRAKKKFNYKK